MKKTSSLFFTIAILCLSQVSSAHAIGAISPAEQKIIDSLQSGVVLNETKLTLQASDINAAKNYLSSHELSESQISTVLNQIESAKAYIKSNNVTDLAAIKGKHGQKILQYVQAAASALDLNLSINSDGTVSLKDKSGKTVYSSSGVIKKTGYDFSQTIYVSAVLILVLFSTAVFSIKMKKKEETDTLGKLELC